MNTTMIVGIALAFAGFLGFAATLFGGGGVAKSEQLRVIGEVMSGRQGAGPRRVMAASLGLALLGALVAFAGVAAHDAERPARCQAHCAAHGYPQSALGPADVPAPSGRQARVFACRCTRADGASTVVRASDL